MFCELCGSKIPDGATFCPQCGVRLGSTQQNWQQPVAPAQPYYQGMPNQGAPVNSYYAQEFANIAQGNPSRFNMAAFFFGPYHLLYRGSGKRFCKLYLPYLIVWAGFLIINTVQSVAIFNGGEGTVFITGWLAAVCLSLWSLGLAFYNGATFNRKYYEQVEGNPAARTHGGRMTALIIAMVLVSSAVATTVLSAGYSAFFGDGYYSDYYSDDYNDYYEDDYDSYDRYGNRSSGYAYDGNMAVILRDYAPDIPEQAAYNGYIPDALVDAEFAHQVDGSYMFYSEEITIGTLLGSVPYTLGEDEVRSTGHWMADAVCEIGATDVHFTIVVSDNYIWIDEAYTQRADDTSGDVYWLDEEEMSAVLLYLYAQVSPDVPLEDSVTRQMRGTWVGENQTQVTMDALWFGDMYYTLGTMINGKVQAWVDEESDLDGATYYLFGLDEAGKTLSVEAFTSTDVLLRTETYTRQIA